ncbi:MAG: sugar kinase [Bacteroidota bacterium]
MKAASLDLIAVGEVLIDLISADYVNNLGEVKTFTPHVGGSPANMAGNLARLSWRTALVATVGRDGAGQLIRDQLASTGMDLSQLRTTQQPTTLILVSRSRQSPEFEAYREADCQIVPTQLTPDFLRRTRILHTTAFALSREPARTNILEAAAWAAAEGIQLSIDVNYAAKIWPDRAEAQYIIGEYLRQGALAKFSDVDYERLFGEAVTDPAIAGQRILKMGAKLVCLTLGEQGAYILTAKEGFTMPVRPVEVLDTTGAGDAYWSGFLSGWLAGRSPQDCAHCGRSLAELKIACVGPLPAKVERELLDR